jgi:cysteinyl-tRNA synthetase
LQTHYRSTFDFSNEALQAAEKGLKRMWEAYEILLKLQPNAAQAAGDKDLDEKSRTLLQELNEFIEDDFGTARVLANMFELVPVINSIKDGHIKLADLAGGTVLLMQQKFTSYLVDIFGLKSVTAAESSTLSGIMQLLIDIRKDARDKKDFSTSDKIRNQVNELGIVIKDEKDGSMSWSIA